MKTFEILSTKVLCKQSGRYIGWPTITKASNGDLIVVFSGDRDGHICMAGKTQMVRSKDNGTTWLEPVTITNTPFDDRDAGIITLDNGTLIVSWFTSYFDPDNPAYISKNFSVSMEKWRPYVENLTESDKKKWLGACHSENKYQWESGRWIRRSLDSGYTWERPIKVTASAPHGPIELSDNSILFVGVGISHGKKIIVAEKSYDKGKSWNVEGTIKTIVDDKNGHLVEPHAVEADDNQIVAMFRYNRKHEDRDSEYQEHMVLWQADSTDGGKTWSDPYPTKIWGHPPHLTKLRDGKLLVTYGHRREPFGQRACFSYDGGKTWDYKNEVILSDPGIGDLGYPASLELDDGTIITVYYEKDFPNEKPCLKATHWKV